MRVRFRLPMYTVAFVLGVASVLPDGAPHRDRGGEAAARRDRRSRARHPLLHLRRRPSRGGVEAPPVLAAPPDPPALGRQARRARVRSDGRPRLRRGGEPQLPRAGEPPHRARALPHRELLPHGADGHARVGARRLRLRSREVRRRLHANVALRRRDPRRLRLPALARGVRRDVLRDGRLRVPDAALPERRRRGATARRSRDHPAPRVHLRGRGRHRASASRTP